MAFEPLKYIYNENFYSQFIDALQKVVYDVNKEEFLGKIFISNWDSLELKERMKHSSFVLNFYLDSDFEKASNQIINTLEILDFKEVRYSSLALMFLPDYIETYGINHFDVAMKSFESITKHSSCEFAVRPFIMQNQEKALAIMLAWSKHENFHIRRLASEGCRPKLPWAMALKKLQKDPKPILPILENLMADKEDYVYRSVANNLNDISKDHPNLVLNIAKKWNKKTKTTDWLVKHSLRTLLKAGNQEAMQIFGYGAPENVQIKSFQFVKKEIKIGEYLEFCFEILNTQKAINRLEYAIYFLRQNGTLSKKVFKISEKEYTENSKTKIEKKHSFKLISTRKYNIGKHKISIIANGIESETQSFILS